MADLIKSLTKINEYKVGLMTLRKTSSKFVNKLYKLGFTGHFFPEAMLSFFLTVLGRSILIIISGVVGG